MAKNKLYYGDNLTILREQIAPNSVDVVYLDPPFNSNRSYNILFKDKSGVEAQAQIQAFDDTWTWSQDSERIYDELVLGTGPTKVPTKVADAIEALRRLLGDNDVLAYLVMMTVRLLELHRALKPTGSLYLHCDPTASHYLKVLLDAIFGVENFRNEIIWRRTGSHGPRRSYGPIHDTLLFYTKSKTYYFNVVRLPYTRKHVESRYTRDHTGELKFTSGGNVLTGAGRTGGESGAVWRGFDPSAKDRHWAIPGFLTEQMPPEFQELGVLAKLDALYEAGLVEITEGNAWPVPVRYLREGDGQPISDIWAYQPGTEGVLYGTNEGIDHDVAWLGPTDPERLGYQTQKPKGLLLRILKSSCPPDGVVLDPFCGCGTTIDAAQELGLRWMGIDITYLAVDLIKNRLIGVFGPEITETFDIEGVPTDMDGARALFNESPFDFERWAVSKVNGTPNEKQVGDRGIDGVARFPLDAKKALGRVLISVKGGKAVGPTAVRDLIGTMKTQRAEMGILIVMEKPTKGVLDAVRASGNYTWPFNGEVFPKVQVMTVDQLLRGEKPKLPPLVLPYLQARPRVEGGTQGMLDA